MEAKDIGVVIYLGHFMAVQFELSVWMWLLSIDDLLDGYRS